MIQLITAEPGSGKTYFVVKYLLKFCIYDPLYRIFTLNPDVLIISNIEDLKIQHWTLNHCLGLEPDQELSEADPARVVAFFSKENFLKIIEKTRKSHIILVIDEAHDIFPPEFKDASVRSFFAWHRHAGIDVLIMTQGIEFLSKIFVPLVEFMVHAVPRSKKMSKSFTYKFRDKKGKFLYLKKLGCDQLVFSAYSSFRHDEVNKPRSAVKIWLVAVMCIFIFAGGLMKYAVSTVQARGSAERAKIEAASIPIKTLNTVSELRTAVVPPAAPDVVPQVPTPELVVWETLYLDGYALMRGCYWYVYHGEYYQHDPERFRNFDKTSKTVEYFGKKLAPVLTASSRS